MCIETSLTPQELQQVKQSFETRQESLASQRAEERKAVEVTAAIPT